LHIDLSAARQGLGKNAATQVRTHYDQAAAAHPEEYKKSNTTLESWLGFLIGRQLVIRHPSDMIEITVGGKDFLKYLVHWGREADQRKF
jgi:hypothetical protein